MIAFIRVLALQLPQQFQWVELGGGKIFQQHLGRKGIVRIVDGRGGRGRLKGVFVQLLRIEALLDKDLFATGLDRLQIDFIEEQAGYMLLQQKFL